LGGNTGPFRSQATIWILPVLSANATKPERWRAPTLIDLGASFLVNSLTNVLTLYIAAAPNGSDISVRVVEEVSDAAAEFTITTDMPAATQLLSPRNYMNIGATAAVVAYDCSGVYVETDY
jgi:hypothetical protein